MTVIRTNIWNVTIQYVAPGEFPQQLVGHFQVPADNFADAYKKALAHEQDFGLDPQVLAITRVKPPIP